MTKYKYIGERSRLTPCEFLSDEESEFSGMEVSCVNGSCEGYIDGVCPFCNGDMLLKEFSHLFKEI